MYADFDRLTGGGRHAGVAADHAHLARLALTAVSVAPGMFGETASGANAEAVMSAAHERHSGELDDHHQALTWVSNQSTGIVTALGAADLVGRDVIARSRID
jgi:hypothetical protein